MKKRFSVVIATYNREQYLCQAIDSVLAQTFTNYEFIVVDDGSTDGTASLLESYGTRITVMRQVNQGSEMAYKAGVAQATGEYIAFLDSDDFFLPNALATYERVIRALDSPPLVIGAMASFLDDQYVPADSADVNDIQVFKYCDYLSKEVPIGMAQSRIVMQKRIFEEVQGGTGRPLARNMNDYRLILRAGTCGPCIIVKQPVTLAYRQHETQSSKGVENMCKGVLYLIQLVQRGQGPRTSAQLLPLYAYLGGPVREWSMKAFKSRLPVLALKILISGFPMLTAALLRKALLFFQPSTVPLVIENETDPGQDPNNTWA